MASASGSDRLALCYHGVSETWPEHFSVTPAALGAQIGYLRRRGYRGVTFSELAESRSGGRLFAVTFDDGYSSVLARALPVLAAHGIPGTAFVCAGLVGNEALALTARDWRGTAHR